jgi:ketosteroid isomerase-like protein
MTTETAIPTRKEQTETMNTTDLIKAFTAAFTSDNIENWKKLLAPDGEWKIMATGEVFSGLDKMVELANRSVAARKHSGELGIKPLNVFQNEEGTKLCWEYMHTGIVTDNWPSTSSHKPTPGTKFTLPIMLMCEVKDGKLIEVREYFDLLTLLEPGIDHHLYS